MPQIIDQTTAEDTAWTFQVPNDVFGPVMPAGLVWSATLADGSPLPEGLLFDPVTRTFSGRPPQDFNGQLSFQVTAADGEATYTTTFALDVTPVDDAPILSFHPLYSNDFQPGSSSNWVYYNPDGSSQLPLPVATDNDGNAYLSSRGPWWLDPNHTSPGAGFLHLLAIGYAEPGRQEMSVSSLVGLQITVDMRTADLNLPEGAHIRFWFQAEDPRLLGSARIVNYALDVAIEDLLTDGEWTTITLTLSDDDAMWIPLFSNPSRTDTYNQSATIRDALEGRLIDSGFIIMMDNEHPETPVTGEVMLDNIRYEQSATPEVRYEGGGALQALGLNARYSDVDNDTVGLKIALTVTSASATGAVGLILPQDLEWLPDGLWQAGLKIADISLASDASSVVISFLVAVPVETVNVILAALAYAGSADGGGRDFLSLVVTDNTGATSAQPINVWRPAIPIPHDQSVTLTGDAGRNWLHGADGGDILYGLDGDDYLDGHAGADLMIGGRGNDWYFIDNAGDVVDERPGEGLEDRIFTSISYRLAAGVEIEILTTTANNGTAAINLAGNELNNLIYGNAGDNILEGGEGDDLLVGYDGADRLYGGNGADTLNGGDGDDILDGRAGADWMTGGAGNDWYTVDDAADRVEDHAGEGDLDRVFASVSYRLSSGAEIEVMSTTDHAGTASINLAGNEFNNRIQGNEGDNILEGGGGDDILVGAGGDDQLYGGEGVDMLNGGDGDDSLDGGAGADWMAGGAGNDWYFVDDASDRVEERVGQGELDRVFASVSYRLASGAEIEIMSTSDHTGTAAINLAGNEFNNRIQGNEGDNILEGGAGDDVLIGAGGNDQLYGGEGTDALNGGVGDDILDGGAGADWMVGGVGNDWYFVDNAADRVEDYVGEGELDRLFASVSYRLTSGAEIEIVSTTDHAGTAAIDLAGNEFNNRIQGNEGANTLEGGAGDDILVGAGGNDRLYGNEGSDTLNGGEGDDILDGGAGADWMLGGVGDDWYFVENPADRIDERVGEGSVDRVFASTSYRLGVGVEIEIISTTDHAGTTAIDLAGNGFANRVQGNEGDNTLEGGAGSDVLVGGGGNDHLYGNLIGSVGTDGDTFQGGLGDDMLWGGSGDDLYLFSAGDGRDTVHDAGGHDTLLFLGSITAADIIFQIVGNDLFVALRDPANPEGVASAAANFIRIVGGGVRSATIESIVVGSQTIDVTALDLPWSTGTPVSAPVAAAVVHVEPLRESAPLKSSGIVWSFPDLPDSHHDAGLPMLVPPPEWSW